MEVELLRDAHAVAGMDEVDGIRFERQTKCIVGSFTIDSYQTDCLRQEIEPIRDPKNSVIRLKPLLPHVSEQIFRGQFLEQQEYIKIGQKLQEMCDASLRSRVQETICEKAREKKQTKIIDESQLFEPFKAVVKGLFDNIVDMHTITMFQTFGYEFAKYIFGENFVDKLAFFVNFMVRFIHRERVIPGADGEDPITIADWVANNDGWIAVFTAGMATINATASQVSSKPVSWEMVCIVTVNVITVVGLLLGRKYM